MCYAHNGHHEKSDNNQKQLEAPHLGTKTQILHTAVQDTCDEFGIKRVGFVSRRHIEVLLVLPNPGSLPITNVHEMV